MRNAVWAEIGSDLKALKKKHLFRSPEIIPAKNTPPLVDFSSNDYLGLSRHPRLARKAAEAAQGWGTSSRASRLLSGNLGLHVVLEKKLAQFKKEKAALVFSSGYLANLGAVGALAGEKDVVIIDRRVHASLVDAARLSRAKLWVYRHRDLEALELLLRRGKVFRRRLVLTDAYFSMDGTVAPLDAILWLCKKYDAVLMADEAHSTGVYGKKGRGLTEYFGLSGKIPVVMGTLSKALGSVGGFIAGPAILRETLVNRSREYIYTTGPSPCASAAALEAVTMIEERPDLRKSLWQNVRHLRRDLTEAGFDLMDSEGPIVPIRVGDIPKTLRLKEQLRKRGFLVSAIRPPTVPKGTARLRLSVCASHSSQDLSGLARALKKAWGKSP